MCSLGISPVPFVQLMLFIKFFGSWFNIIYPVTDSQSLYSISNNSEASWLSTDSNVR